MELDRLLGEVAGEFSRQGIDYALIGGLALGLLGVPRATVDIDLLVRREDLERIDVLLRGLGYERCFVSENVSQYVHQSALMGEIDLLHAFRGAARAMLAHARSVHLPASGREVRVVRPEDLIGLKVQALANDPDRRDQDTADIRALIREHGPDLDWKLIGDYFELFGESELLDRLRPRP